MARSSVDFPAPLGPITPSPSPAARVKAARLIIGSWSVATATASWETARALAGRGRESRASRVAGSWPSRVSSLPNA